MHQISIQMWKFLFHSNKNEQYSVIPTNYCISQNVSACQNILIRPAEWSLFSAWRMSNTNTTRIRSQHWEMWNIMSKEWEIIPRKCHRLIQHCLKLQIHEVHGQKCYDLKLFHCIANMPVMKVHLEYHLWLPVLKWPVVSALFLCVKHSFLLLNIYSSNFSFQMYTCHDRNIPLYTQQRSPHNIFTSPLSLWWHKA